MGIFSAANAVLLVAFLGSGHLPAEPRVGLIVSLVGLLMSVVWLFLQRRALMLIERHENVMRNLEDKLGLEAQLRVSTSFTQPNGGIRAREVMPKWIYFWITFWAVMCFYFFITFSLMWLSVFCRRMNFLE